jgi:hypothetical protein
MATTSGEASAGILGWLGRMSGPGGFITVDASVCIKKPKGKTTDAQEHEPPTLVVICPQTANERYARHWSFYATGGVAGSVDNNLTVNGRNGHSVWILSLGGAADYTVAPWVAIGAGAGINHFIGDDFKGFTRPYVAPYVSIRPGVIGKKNLSETDDRAEAVRRSFIVTAGMHVLFADLDGASFGAPNDPWEGAKNEARPFVSVGVDLLMLLHKKDVKGY